MKVWKRFAQGVAASAAIALSSVGAQAQVLDFQVGSAGSCYTFTCSAHGYDFAFVSGGWAITDDANGYFNRNGLGSSGLISAGGHGNGSPPITITMTKTGGGAFNLSSFLGATGLNNTVGPVTLDLLGNYSGGGTVSAQYTLDGTFDSYSVSGFNNIDQVVFSTRSIDGFGLDNLDTGAGVSVVPEPSSVVLLASGLAGLLVAARRRRKV